MLVEFKSSPHNQKIKNEWSSIEHDKTCWQVGTLILDHTFKKTGDCWSPRVWNRVSDFNTKRMIGGGSAPVTRSGTTKGNIMFLSHHIDMDCSLGFNGHLMG